MILASQAKDQDWSRKQKTYGKLKREQNVRKAARKAVQEVN